MLHKAFIMLCSVLFHINFLFISCRIALHRMFMMVHTIVFIVQSISCMMLTVF